MEKKNSKKPASSIIMEIQSSSCWTPLLLQYNILLHPSCVCLSFFPRASASRGRKDQPRPAKAESPPLPCPQVLSLFRSFILQHTHRAMDGYNRSRRSYSYSYDSSYGNGMMQIESYYGPPRPLPITAATPSSSSSSSYELRSYNASYAQAQMDNSGGRNNKGRDFKLKKGKSISGSSSWGLNDPELQRRKRVASYKMYSVEGKVKGSLRKSFRWLKDKYTQVVYGWW